MSDDIQVIDYSNSPAPAATPTVSSAVAAASRSSPAPGRTSTKSPAISKPQTPSSSVVTTTTTAASSHFGHNEADELGSQTKYAALLTVIEELGRDVRPTYAGNKLAAERLKRGIVHARVLVRECMSESDRMNRGGN